MTIDKHIYLAPMVGWTTPLFREFIQCLNPETYTFTEMVVLKSLIYSQNKKKLRLDPAEKNVICQLATADPGEFEKCLFMKDAFSEFKEINLNIGCPSQKVQNGGMGACMMQNPKLVRSCIHEMKKLGKRISIKCRLGVNNQSFDDLLNFIDQCSSECDKFYIHARYALLDGINPKQNRSVPPIDYASAIKLKDYFPKCDFVINGEINTVKKAQYFLNVDATSGIMIGRAAYQNPKIFATLSDRPQEMLVSNINRFVEKLMCQVNRDLEWFRVVTTLTHGLPNAKAFRRALSENRELCFDDYWQKFGERFFQ